MEVLGFFEKGAGNMRLVNADALLSELEKYNDLSAREKNEYLFGMQQRLETCIELVEDAPTVDAVPVRRGQWKMVEGELSFWDMCSECGRKILHLPRTPYYDFCPNCGADMRKDGDSNG